MQIQMNQHNVKLILSLYAFSVKMYLPNRQGNTIHPTSGCISNTTITTGMWNFECLYKLSAGKIINDFTEFNANLSG